MDQKTTHTPAMVPLDFTDFLDSLEEHAASYVERERAHLTAQAAHRAGKAVGALVPLFIVLRVLLLALLLMVFAGAMAWGRYLGDHVLGFFYTGLAVLGAGTLLFVLRPFISKPIRLAIAGSALDVSITNDDQLDHQLAELRTTRDRTRQALLEHFRVIKEPEFRGALLKDALYDAMRTSAPFKYFRGLFAGWDR